MTMTLSGSGTIAGLVAGGLPDATVTASDLASGAARTNFGAGAVLQVVYGSVSTEVSSSTNTLVDTGLTASITPTSETSKILVLVNHFVCQKQTSAISALKLTLLRNSTNLIGDNVNSLGYTGTTNTNIFSVSFDVLDSPATISSVTYKTQFCSANNTASVEVQRGSSPSTITLVEIAA